MSLSCAAARERVRAAVGVARSELSHADMNTSVTGDSEEDDSSRPRSFLTAASKKERRAPQRRMHFNADVIKQ